MNRRGIRFGRPRGGSRRPNVYTMMLMLQLLDRIASLDPKPPITVFMIIFNLSLFYFKPLSEALPPSVVSVLTPLLSRLAVRKACLQPSAVLSGQFSRLIVSSFIHLSDTHVLYNSLSFLYKGVTLEAAMGSIPFLALIFYLGFTAHVFYVVIAMLARNYGYGYLMKNCVAGFSGVIFGLKVVLNANPQYGQVATRIFGLPFPAGVAPWAELFVVSALMPNVSFLGHLCGILAGLTYVHGPPFLRTLPLLSFFPTMRTFRPYRAFQGRPRHLHEE